MAGGFLILLIAGIFYAASKGWVALGSLGSDLQGSTGASYHVHIIIPLVGLLGLIVLLVGLLTGSHPTTPTGTSPAPGSTGPAHQDWQTCATCKRIVAAGLSVCPVCGGPTGASGPGIDPKKNVP